MKELIRKIMRKEIDKLFEATDPSAEKAQQIIAMDKGIEATEDAIKKTKDKIINAEKKLKISNMTMTNPVGRDPNEITKYKQLEIEKNKTDKKELVDLKQQMQDQNDELKRKTAEKNAAVTASKEQIASIKSVGAEAASAEGEGAEAPAV